MTAVSTPAPGARRRLPTIDVLRGLYMVLIVCSHAANNLAPDVPRWQRDLVGALSSGTVGFATVSGMLVGYFFATRADMGPIIVRYRVQAFRLLVLAHPLMAVLLYPPFGTGQTFTRFVFGNWFITDTLAVLFVILVPFVGRIPPLARLAVGWSLLIVARLLLAVPATSGAPLLAIEILAGVSPQREHILLSNYALLSIAGVFLVGAYVGHVYAEAQKRDALRQLTGRLVRVAPVLIVTGAALVFSRLLLHDVMGGHGPLRGYFYVDYFLTAYPFYFGVTLLLLALFIWRDRVGPVEKVLALFGKTSLFTYVVQYFAVQTAPYHFGLEGTLTIGGMFLLVACVMPVLYLAARVWNHFVKQA